VTKHKIGFIVHSGSGSKRKQQAKEDFEAYILKDTGYDLFKLDKAEDIVEVTADMALKNYEAVYACGGDGTLNLVSGGLIHTETALGIIPFGSGNGYARHHNMPLDWAQALKSMDNHIMSQRDTGLINGMHFLNMAGIGYSAKISQEFKNSRGRGLRGYLNSIGKNLKTGAFPVSLSNKDAVWAGESFMVDFANGSQWGNNVKIAPNTRDDDGILAAVVFKKISPLRLPVIGFKLLTNTSESSTDIYRVKGEAFILQFEGEQPMHVDGDYVGVAQEKVVVEVNHKSLKLWLFNNK
jgi:diacylglycerol kinase (ATP)